MKRALSLLEVLVVVFILGLVAALAIPRISVAASESETDVRSSLNVLRFAIELYYQDHGTYPGQQTDGVNPAESAEAFVSQLTRYTDEAGLSSVTKDAQYRFGPYLRLGMPACPVLPNRGATTVLITSDAPRCTTGWEGFGWIYNPHTGDIAINSEAKDAAGVRYDQY